MQDKDCYADQSCRRRRQRGAAEDDVLLERRERRCVLTPDFVNVNPGASKARCTNPEIASGDGKADLAACQARCVADATCAFIVHWSDNGCQRFTSCTQGTHTWGVDSTVYQVRLPCVLAGFCKCRSRRTSPASSFSTMEKCRCVEVLHLWPAAVTRRAAAGQLLHVRLLPLDDAPGRRRRATYHQGAAQRCHERALLEQRRRAHLQKRRVVDVPLPVRRVPGGLQDEQMRRAGGWKASYPAARTTRESAAGGATRTPRATTTRLHARACRRLP